MGHANLYADQERVLTFIDARMGAGEDDRTILADCCSIDALAELGHAITREDLADAARYAVWLMGLAETAPADPLGCIALIRRAFRPLRTGRSQRLQAIPA
jgi:hypothetical protein